MTDQNIGPVPVTTDLGPYLAQIRNAITTGLTLAATAGYFTADVGSTTNAIIAVIMGIAFIANLVWSGIANSRAAKIKDIAAVHDVAVIVGPQAPPDAIKVAIDPNVPGAVPVSATVKIPPGAA